jgi:hypothetical protein
VSLRVVSSQPPSFAVDAVVPPVLTLISPVPDANDQLVVDWSADLELRWAGSPPFVRVSLGGVAADGGTWLRCTLPGVGGVGIIPAAALQRLRGFSSRSIEVNADDHHELQSGGWRVVFDVEQFGLFAHIPDG